MRTPRLLRRALPLAAVWIVSGTILSIVTIRVRDWLAMPNELLNERRAISVTQSFSLLPTIHEKFVASYDQLYPLVISPAFAYGGILAGLQHAHAVNAFLMTSACIPVYLLTRRLTSSIGLGYLIAFLSICMPWIFFSSLLMNEVVAYPVCAWTVLAFQRALVAPSGQRDLAALGAVLLSFFARTQLVLLLAVLPVAIVAYELARADAGNLADTLRAAARKTLTGHRVLVTAYAIVAATAVALAATGGIGHVFGVYGGAVSHDLVPHGIPRSIVWHIATFSLGLAVLPFVIGTAWLLTNVVRPPNNPEHRAFACIGVTLTVALFLQVTTFDLRYVDGGVLDRYLIYLVPIALAALACALEGPGPSRLMLTLVSGVVMLGFLIGPIPALRDATPNTDEPIRSFYPTLVASMHSVTATRVLLIGGTALLTLLFATAHRLLPRQRSMLLVSALTVVAFPLLTAQMFAEIFRANGPSSRAVTSPAGAAYSWIDARVGPDARVAIAPYPVSDAYLVNQRVWRDYEFWNKTVVRDIVLHSSGSFIFTNATFPKLYASFDSATGLSNISPGEWVVQADQDTRARFAGTVVAQTEVMLIRTSKPSRAEWLSSGLYDDGWTRPGVPATVRVFPVPGASRAAQRSLTFGFRSLDDSRRRPVTIASNLSSWTGTATSETQHVTVTVCVPPNGHAEVELRAPVRSPIPGDLADPTTATETRIGGIFIGQISLADEIGGPCLPTKTH